MSILRTRHAKSWPLLAGVALSVAACGSTQPRGTMQDFVVSGGASAAPGTVLGTTPGAQSSQQALPGGGSTSGTTGVGVPGAGGSTGGSGNGTTTGTSGTSGSTGSTGSTGTVTASTITVGVLLTDPGSNGGGGISNGNTVTEQKVDEALFNAINKAGGIHGMKVTPIFAATHTTSTNWSTDFAAACQTFTQDHHVNAVLGYLFNYDQNFETCLTNNNIPHLSTGYNIPDATELAKHPLHRSLAVPTIDVRSLAKLKSAISEGVLTPKNKLAVVLDGCPGTLQSWQRVAKPLLDSAHIPYISGGGDGCSNGDNASASDSVAGVPNELLKLRQENVDTITFLGVSEGPALLIVANAAESQHWNPRYIVSSLGNLSALQQNGGMQSDQAENVYGYGWLPSQDVGPAQQPAPSASEKKCLSLLKSQGVVPQQFGDYANFYRICNAVFAYQAAVDATGGNLAGPAVVAAVDALGTSYNDPDVLDGASIFGRGYANNAPAHLRDVRYKISCKCFNYVGATRPMPRS